MSLLSNTYVLSLCGWVTAEQACAKKYPIAVCCDAAILALHVLTGAQGDYPNVMDHVAFEFPSKWDVYVDWKGKAVNISTDRSYNGLLPVHAEAVRTPGFGERGKRQICAIASGDYVLGYDHNVESTKVYISRNYIPDVVATLYTPTVSSGFVLVGLGHSSGEQTRVAIAVAPFLPPATN